MSRLRRYKAHSVDACIEAARRDFGADAVIHAIRSRREGFLRRRTVHELLAGPASSLQSIAAAGGAMRTPRGAGAAGMQFVSGVPSAPGAAPQPGLRASIARRAYGAGPLSPSVGAGPMGALPAGDGADADASPLVPAADLDRRRTQLLAQAMSIRMERDEQARRLAAANEGALAAEAAGRQADFGVAGDGSSALGSHTSDPTRALMAPPPSAAQRFVLLPADGGEAARRARMAAPPPRAREVESPSVGELAADIRALRALVERVISSRASGEDVAMAEEFLSTPAPWCDALDASRVGGVLAGFYATLIGHSMAADLARRIIEEARDALTHAECHDPIAVRGAVRNRIAALLPPCDAATMIPRRGERPHVISLVGPTGTGKTTTIAKLAAGYALRHDLRVGLVTTDTFRIGAVEQLRTYADIVGIPLEVAKGVRGVRSACRRLADRDVILIDTAGRGHADRERIGELARLLHAAQPDETHLVLSSTGRAETLVSQAESFAPVGADRVVVAKLDETVGFGVLLGALHRIGTPVSWLTTGQHVPNDIEPARSERLAELVVESGVAAEVRDSVIIENGEIEDAEAPEACTNE